MKNLLIIGLAFVVIANANAQNLKTFSGKYAQGFNPNGIATYTYYEDPKTHDYIKHGDFEFNLEVNSDDEGYAKVTIKGKFKDGKRDGLWTYITVLKDFKDVNKENTYGTGTRTIKANYSDGYPNGLWSETVKNKNRQRQYSLLNWDWGSYTKEFNSSVVLHFNKGAFSGSVKLVNHFNKYNLVRYNLIEGQCDENGYMIGKWVFDGKVMLFDKGLLINETVRNEETGKVLKETKDSEELSNFKKQFVSGSLTKELIKEKRIQIDTITTLIDLSSTQIIDDELFYKYIDGDLSLYYEKKNYQDYYENLRTEGNYITLKIIEYKNLQEDINFIQAEKDLSSKRYYQASAEYSKLIERKDPYSNLKMFSPEDIELLESKLDECNRLWEEQKRADTLNREMQYIREINKIKRFPGLESLQSDLNKYENLITKYQDIIKPNDLNYLEGLITEIKPALEKKRKEELLIKRFERIQTNQKKIEEIYNLQKITKSNSLLNAVADLDLPESSKMEAQNKPKIYDAYYSIYVQEWNNKNIQQSDIHQSKMLKIQEKMFALINTDTKELEKLLKKAKTTEEKKQIFLN